MKSIEEYVRSIPDFPEPGIIFRDVTSVLQDADGLHLAIDLMQKKLEGVDFDLVVGPESRGFIFGVPIAYNLHKPFIPIRKKGKLPCETVSIQYDLEYGTAELEMHRDSVKPGQRVVIIDDLIATGGTNEAMIKLIASVASMFCGQQATEFAQALASCAFEYGRLMLYRKEQALVTQFIESQHRLDEELEKKYAAYLSELEAQSKQFYALIDHAFAPDFRTAFLHSILLAEAAGVKESEILSSTEDIDSFFLD